MPIELLTDKAAPLPALGRWLLAGVVCVARYKYLTPTEPVAGFAPFASARPYVLRTFSFAAAPAEMPPGLRLFKTVLDFLELAIG